MLGRIRSDRFEMRSVKKNFRVSKRKMRNSIRWFLYHCGTCLMARLWNATEICTPTPFFHADAGSCGCFHRWVSNKSKIDKPKGNTLHVMCHRVCQFSDWYACLVTLSVRDFDWPKPCFLNLIETCESSPFSKENLHFDARNLILLFLIACWVAAQVRQY